MPPRDPVLIPPILSRDLPAAEAGGAEVPLDSLTALGAAGAVRRGELSVAALVGASLRRIAERNDRINAIVTLDTAGAALAVDAARRRLAEGGVLPSLLGVPVSIKDAFATAGLRTTASHRPLRDYVPAQDATVVARLRAAGAVIVGKSNLPELAGAPHCWSPLFGLTRNPWNPELTPGGSSGGAAAAVASGFSLLETGSDLAGSIRIPAAYCGVAGFKATENRIPRSGHIPHLPASYGGVRSVRHMLSLGVLARSVADLHLGYHLMAGPDGVDIEVPAIPPPAPLPAPTGRRLRLALWDDFGLPLCARTLAAFERVAKTLAAAGHEVCRGTPPGLDPVELHDTFGRIAGAEIGLGMPGWQRGILPVARHLLPRSERLLGAIARGMCLDMRDYNRALARRDEAIAGLERHLAAFDALLCPVATTVAYAGRPQGAFSKPPKLMVDGRRLPYLEATIGLTVPFSLTGSPVVALPAGIEAGLPVGLQVVGRRWEDDAVLAVAAELESLLGGFVAPPWPA
jgi:amidase